MLLLGVLQAQAEVAGAGSYDLLETEILASSQAAIEFTDLGAYASTYQHLQVRAVFNQNTTGGAVELSMQLNGDTAGNYSWHRLTGNGSTVTSGASANASFMFVGVVPLYGTSDIFSAAVIDLLDPFETSKYSTVRSLSGITGTVNEVHLHSGSWRNTNSITSMKFQSTFSSSLRSGTRFSLYGLRSA